MPPVASASTIGTSTSSSLTVRAPAPLYQIDLNTSHAPSPPAEAQEVLRESKEVKIHGPVSSYTDEFSQRLKMLYDLVENKNVSEVDFEDISNAITQLKYVCC